jgi:monothiol glutaredoxin
MLTDDIKKQITGDINNNKIMLYMKGTPAMPQCGFSQATVSIIQSYNMDFQSSDVLSDEGIRQGIKEFSDWPTIPQLYVNGEFIGGCDIITDMHQNGELKTLLNK